MGPMHRKPGPKGKFASMDAQLALLAFLNDASKSNRDAAEHFGCSERTVEYALARIRSAIKENTPAALSSDTGRGRTDSSTTPEGMATPIVAQTAGTTDSKEDQ